MTCAARGDDSKQPLTVDWYRAGALQTNVVFVVCDRDINIIIYILPYYLFINLHNIIVS